MIKHGVNIRVVFINASTDIFVACRVINTMLCGLVYIRNRGRGKTIMYCDAVYPISLRAQLCIYFISTTRLLI